MIEAPLTHRINIDDEESLSVKDEVFQKFLYDTPLNGGDGFKWRADRVPVGAPTFTYTRDKEPPVLSGLYNRFTPDQVISRLSRFEARTGHYFKMARGF